LNRRAWIRAAAASALAALAAAAAYRGTLNNGFVWDDHVHIESAPFVKDAANARVLLTPAFWTGRVEVEGSARPVLLASLLADRALWGEKPAGYHLTNLLLHCADAAALAWLAWLLLGSAAAAALAGLIFALHPVQSEAVCGIMFRADPLAALGVLLALVLLRLACARRSAALTAAAAAAFAFALLSKESAAVFPALALLIEALFPSGPAAARTRRTAAAAFAVVLLAYAAFRLPRGGYAPAANDPRSAPAAPTRATTQFHESDPEWKAAMRDPATRLRTMSGVLGDDARLVLWPAGLQADRSAPIVTRWSSPRAWAGWAFLLASLAAAWSLRAVLPGAALGLLWFLIALAPVSGILALPNLSAERYLYLPLAGAALALAAALESAARRFRRPRAALALVSAALLAPAAAATLRRVPAWRDDASLFGGAPASDSARLRYNRGLLAQRAGRLAEADEEYRKAADLNPASVEALVNLAEVERLRGREAERLALLRRAVAANPGSPIAYEALGSALDEEGRGKEALAAYSKAVGADSRWPSVRKRYAVALERAGRYDEALEQAAVGVELEPKSAAARYALGRLSQQAGRRDAAIAAFREAVRLDPSDGLAWANLGACLEQSGDAAGALAPTRRAAELMPGSAEARRNLGAVLDELGRLAESEAAYADAVRRDPSSALSWHGYGVVLQKSGDLSRADAAYRNALKAAPDKVESLANLASLRAGAGDLDEALSLLERARAVRPDDLRLRAAYDEVVRRREAAGKAK